MDLLFCRKCKKFVLLVISLILMDIFWDYMKLNHDRNKIYGEVVDSFADLQPFQTATDKGKFMFKGCEFTPLYDYSIKAKVVSKKSYNDSTGFLSKYDLLLLWGKYVGKHYYSKIKFGQRNRWGFWNWKNINIDDNDFNSHVANNHIIPADESIEMFVADVNDGDLVSLKGSLVKVYCKEGNIKWKSSISRDDWKDKSCEVFFVESADYVDSYLN